MTEAVQAVLGTPVVDKIYLSTPLHNIYDLVLIANLWVRLEIPVVKFWGWYFGFSVSWDYEAATFLWDFSLYIYSLVFGGKTEKVL